jgi:O-antigen ligase
MVTRAMLQKLRLHLSSFFFLLVGAMTLGTRVLVYQFIPGFHEYEAVFLYASDVFVLGFIVLALMCGGRALNIRVFAFTLIFLALSFISIFVASLPLLAAYNFLRLVVLVLLALSLSVFVWRISFSFVAFSFAFFAVLQAIIGFVQFVLQRSVGLHIFGESVLGPFVGGASKIPFGGAALLRAYGTFPHPNVLAAFLLLGLFSLLFLYVKNDAPLYADLYNYKKLVRVNFRAFIQSRHLYIRILIGASIFIVLTGILLTFSRAAWLIALVLTPFFLIGSLFVSRGRLLHRVMPIVRITVLLLLSLGALFNLFGWAAFPRAQISIDEPAVTQRLSYQDIGLHLMSKNVLGVGIGNQVFYSVNKRVYEQFGMTEVWQWQPIHNLYLLIGSEIGLMGLLAFLALVGWVVWRTLKNGLGLEQLTAFFFLFVLLLFGLTDHFLWTLQQGRLMLWVVVGIVVSQWIQSKKLKN